MTELKSKAIKIQGKDYILVSDRVLYFNEVYPNGSISTEKTTDDGDYIEFKATVIPDVKTPERKFTGHSQATWGEGYINKTAALENCETSAVGRALGFMGIGVLDSIASADEIKKAQSQPPRQTTTDKPGYASYKQKLFITKLMKEKNIEKGAMNAAGFFSDHLTSEQASELIDILQAENCAGILRDRAADYASKTTVPETADPFVN